MRALVRVAALLVFASTLGATCGGATPETASLRAVHDRYAEEFVQAYVPASGVDCMAPPPASVAAADAFPRTEAAIRELRSSGGAEDVTLAHVTVLEAMIHLQAGRLNLAREDAAAVADAAPKLRTATGADARDALLARAYPALLAGWSEIDGLQRVGGCAFPAESPDGLEQAADAIRAELGAATARGGLASSEEDAGALYLATSAAIFYVWADKIRDDGCMRRDPEASRACREAHGTTLLERGRTLIGDHLPAACREDPGTAPAPDAAPCPAGLARYTDWYRFLGDEIERGA